GVALASVDVTDTQSAVIPNTPPTTMVATDLIGEALLKACNKLNDRLAKYDGSFVRRVEQAYDEGISLSATASHTAPRLSYDYEKQQGDVSYFFVWGAAVSIVEIDVISGSFRILKNHIVQDCGKSLNPQLDVGQAEGGFMFGVGYYMMEEMIYSSDGKLITDNVSGYKIPSCGDVPLEWNIELLNYRPEGKGLHNSKGIGESSIQLGLSVYFAAKDAVRAARREAGSALEFNLGFPASVDRVSEALPAIANYASSQK
ncbi:MAG: molybdopterin-dependent oxidoreductase, partial [Kofleriaceae bacterium]|nr:molybdopterin-dependent oxidoreductase [Kofleriaceae bacterium]